VSAVRDAIASGRISGRVWFYANYHCNLRCSYCLTESAPGVARRELDPDRIIALAREARELGFTDLGVTGGEPFILPYMPRLVADLAAALPVIVLSNGTLFNERRLRELAPLADLPVHVQISLDSPDPDANDAFRGPDNFRKVVEAVPRLVERGIGVRIATTLEDPAGADRETMERLCALHRALGVSDEDHVVRPIVRRGRARSGGMGVLAGYEQFDPELTITADGAFYSVFGPTVVGGRLDTDLLLTRTVSPLSTPAGALARIVEERPAGDDARLGIR
jgi:MoaA/NifB/PqqE/SkfB family radical SAM enzyme